MAVALLAAASLSCSVGNLLVGSAPAAVPTFTMTPRPTFTPLPGMRTATPTAGRMIRGELPPGVTVVPSQVASFDHTSADLASGITSLILYATETPGPSPTPGPISTPRPTATLGDEGPSAQQVTPVATPYVLVTGAEAIGRRGPAESFPALGKAQAGTTFMLLGRTPDSQWWQICCMANQPAWLPAAVLVPGGGLDTLPVFTPAPTPTPTPPPAPPATPTITPTPLPPFDVARGPEFPIQRDDGVLIIWVKVYEGLAPYERALGGYILKVFRDDVDVSLPERSHDRPFDRTAKTEGEREYNLKFELRDAGEADWRIYLARPDGTRVSPVKQFTTKGDAYRNLVVYIAYWLAR